MKCSLWALAPNVVLANLFKEHYLAFRWRLPCLCKGLGILTAFSLLCRQNPDLRKPPLQSEINVYFLVTVVPMEMAQCVLCWAAKVPASPK